MGLFNPDEYDEPENKDEYPWVYELPLPGDQGEWRVPKQFYEEMVRLHPGIVILDELNRMRAWLISNASNRKTAKGMPRFINNWLGKAQNEAKAAPQANAVSRTAQPQVRGYVTSDVRCLQRNGGYAIYRCARPWEWHQYACRIPMTCCPECGEDMERVNT